MSDPAERQVESSEIGWGAIRQRAIDTAHREGGIPLADPESGYVEAGVNAVIGLLTGQVVLIGEANRVLAEERANMKTIAEERERYREALELLKSGRGDTHFPSAEETKVRLGWIYEVVTRAFEPEQP